MERLVEWNGKDKKSALLKCINEWGDTVYIEDICIQLAQIYDILGEDYDIDRLRELVEADRDGRCVITKCKLGDTVFAVGKKKIVKARVQEIYLDDMPELIYLVDFECDNCCDGCPFNSWSQSWEGEWECGGEYGDGSVKQSDFGKTVFLTREAAEAAMKARDGK